MKPTETINKIQTNWRRAEKVNRCCHKVSGRQQSGHVGKKNAGADD